MQVKLAEALLRRKELNEKVKQCFNIKTAEVFETIAKRVLVADGVDDLVAKVPKLNLAQVTQEYDYYARQLRLIDAAIQQANWTTEISVDSMDDYKAPSAK
jgi:hypothetical protein